MRRRGSGSFAFRVRVVVAQRFAGHRDDHFRIPSRFENPSVHAVKPARGGSGRAPAIAACRDRKSVV